MRKLHLIAASIVALFGFAVLPAWAALPIQAPTCPDASEEIISDRPNISTSVVVVPKGSLQVGNGFDWTCAVAARKVSDFTLVVRRGVSRRRGSGGGTGCGDGGTFRLVPVHQKLPDRAAIGRADFSLPQL